MHYLEHLLKLVQEHANDAMLAQLDLVAGAALDEHHQLLQQVVDLRRAHARDAAMDVDGRPSASGRRQHVRPVLPKPTHRHELESCRARRRRRRLGAGERAAVVAAQQLDHGDDGVRADDVDGAHRLKVAARHRERRQRFGQPGHERQKVVFHQLGADVRRRSVEQVERRGVELCSTNAHTRGLGYRFGRCGGRAEGGVGSPCARPPHARAQSLHCRRAPGRLSRSRWPFGADAPCPAACPRCVPRTFSACPDCVSQYATRCGGRAVAVRQCAVDTHLQPKLQVRRRAVGFQIVAEAVRSDRVRHRGLKVRIARLGGEVFRVHPGPMCPPAHSALRQRENKAEPPPRPAPSTERTEGGGRWGCRPHGWTGRPGRTASARARRC